MKAASNSPLPPDAMERIFAALSRAVDAAGPTRTELYLARLALLMAEQIADEARILALVDAARIVEEPDETGPASA